MLTELIYSFDPLLDQELEGRHRVAHVQNLARSVLDWSEQEDVPLHQLH